MIECEKFTSFHTAQWFNHKHWLSCNSVCIIYLIECITHEVANVGYSITNMKIRFSNNKSHFKCKNMSCELVKHLMTVNHDVDFSTATKYDQTLSKHLRVTILEQVLVSPSDSREEKEAKCEIREGYWQTQLKSLQKYGGLNKRDNRKYASLKQQNTQ